ncbi:MAG: hypothetical protein D6788_09145 [Planctomycetota bacterium]|nr:MAG: hypothetical protein D6788_09145 [Planctomycetota bacterium]
MSTLQQGDRISNYILEERVGAGSFGEVWRAKHHVFGEVVAIKIPTHPTYVRNLQREGVAVHGLRHPNIVRAIDLDPYADPPYLVMEYVDGPSLREIIDRNKGTMPVDAVVAVLRGILNALCVAHDAGLIHRDLKPANVLLHRPPKDLHEWTERCVKVTDFGLGQVGGDTTQSILQSGSLENETGRRIAGTIAYMSPEQQSGGPVDARSDLYACGILLFEMLTGERPQGSELPSEVRGGIPGFLDDVFQRCYARLENRFPSARAVLDALAQEPSVPVAEPILVGAGSVCPACRREVHRDDQFCIHCGHQLVASVPRCNRCHAYVHVKDRYCIFCGNDLRVLRA